MAKKTIQIRFEQSQKGWHEFDNLSQFLFWIMRIEGGLLNPTFSVNFKKSEKIERGLTTHQVFLKTLKLKKRV